MIANDDLETYAAIIALWLEGKAYVPMSPETPIDRNQSIISQAEIKTIIDSSDQIYFQNSIPVASKNFPMPIIKLIPNVSDRINELVYILFTSGTTGQPKGVPITRENLTGFVAAFGGYGYQPK